MAKITGSTSEYQPHRFVSKNSLPCFSTVDILITKMSQMCKIVLLIWHFQVNKFTTSFRQIAPVIDFRGPKGQYTLKRAKCCPTETYRKSIYSLISNKLISPSKLYLVQIKENIIIFYRSFFYEISKISIKRL